MTNIEEAEKSLKPALWFKAGPNGYKMFATSFS